MSKKKTSTGLIVTAVLLVGAAIFAGAWMSTGGNLFAQAANQQGPDMSGMDPDLMTDAISESLSADLNKDGTSPQAAGMEGQQQSSLPETAAILIPQRQSSKPVPNDSATASHWYEPESHTNQKAQELQEGRESLQGDGGFERELSTPE